MGTRGGETQDTENTGLTLLPPPERGVGALEASQDTETSRAAPVLGAMAGQWTREAMADRGAWVAMVDPRTQEAMAGQRTREAMADRGAWVSMVDPGTQEAMAEQGAWVAQVDPGTQ